MYRGFNKLSNLSGLSKKPENRRSAAAAGKFLLSVPFQ